MSIFRAPKVRRLHNAIEDKPDQKARTGEMFSSKNGTDRSSIDRSTDFLEQVACRKENMIGYSQNAIRETNNGFFEHRRTHYYMG